MPLHPQAQRVVDAMAALNRPPMDTLSPRDARAFSAAGPKPAAPGVGKILNDTIPGPGGGIPVRIYWPIDHETGSGIIVYYHGGGWVIGDLWMVDGVCRQLANKSGCIVVSVDYRLAPEHKFPAAAEDAYAAVVWARDHGADLGGDGSRIGVTGDSAGGNLTACAAVMAAERGGPAIALQVPIYPVIAADFENQSYRDRADGPILTRAMMRWFWDQYLNDPSEATHPHVAPVNSEHLAKAAPALVITAEYDPLRDEGAVYARALQDAAVSVVHHDYPGVPHGFVTMWHAIDMGMEALDEIASAMKQALA